MEHVNLLFIEDHLQSTVLDQYITLVHPNILNEWTIMEDLRLVKRIENLQLYSHPFKESPVVHIYGTNKQDTPSLACIHQFYPFGFIKLPCSNSKAYILNDPPCSTTYSAAQHTDPTLIKPTSNELAFMLDVYKQLKVLGIQVLLLSLHHYTSIYGFNPLDKFIKITYCLPSDRFKLWNILANGKINNIKFECYHFHFHYTDVFMREFDLIGCAPVLFKSVQYRKLNTKLQKEWLSLNNTSTISTLSTEFDTIVTEVTADKETFFEEREDLLTNNEKDDLLNKEWLQRKWHIPTVKALWYDEYNRRRRYNIESLSSQESVRSVDLQNKSGVFDQQRELSDLTTMKYPEKYPKWELEYRVFIDKLMLEAPLQTCKIHQDYKYREIEHVVDSAFEKVVAYIAHLQMGYASEGEDAILDLMVQQTSSSEDDFIVLQVDGQVDNKIKKHKLIEVLIPKPVKKPKQTPFKPLNLIKTPPRKQQRRVFDGEDVHLWSPVHPSSPTNKIIKLEQLSNAMASPSRLPSARTSPLVLPSTPVFSSLLNSNSFGDYLVYTKSPPLYQITGLSQPPQRNHMLPLVKTYSEWLYVKPPPRYHNPSYSTTSASDTKQQQQGVEAVVPCKVMCVEILAQSHNSNAHYYNAKTDKITCIAYCLQYNWQQYCAFKDVLIINQKDMDELGLLLAFIDLVKQHEPDILLGWDIHNSSFGYIVQRCQLYKIDFCQSICRINNTNSFNNTSSNTNKWSETHTSLLQCSGRLFLNGWRICRNNLELRLYSIENAYDTLFKESFPIPSLSELNFNHSHFNTQFAFDYIAKKCHAVLKILDKIDFICQTIEFSRLYGIPFESVLTRGSQYRVESVLYRLLKNHRMLLRSPTKQQVNQQQAAEFIPLVMEPNSGFYDQCISVFDFQSLYPSIMIAYNYCFSTLLCKINKNKLSTQLGCFEMKDGFDVGLLSQFYNALVISPNGGVFVDNTVKTGILSKLVVDLLDTRVMIKNSMKLAAYKQNKSLLKLLNARQLALKLLANVIYGYCSASFSGRMPMVEVADAIVGMGRWTLKSSKDYLESKYPITCRYGDTDSLFMECTHYSKYGAITLSKQIIKEITARTPFPMKLKFEKLYLKSFLLTKKRYCGYKIESINDTPVFEAKGIETVRRDGCLLTSLLLEKALKEYFENQTKTHVMGKLFEMFNKIQEYPLNYFIIAKEVRVGTYKQNPPGAVVAQRQMENEPGYVSQYGNRQPYLVIYNANKLLKENVVSPQEYLQHKDWIINYDYYIEKQVVPVFERIFQFTNIDIKEIQSKLYKRQINTRYYANSASSYEQLHSICQACTQQSPMHSRPVQCMNYICAIFDEKLKLHGEFF